MKLRQLAILLCAWCATTSLALAASSDLPFWLRAQGNPYPSSLDVFNAFETQAPANAKKYGVAIPLLPSSDAPAVFPFEFRSIDGSGNNLTNTHLGQAETPFLRLTPTDYGDGTGSPSGADRKSARDISNLVNTQSGDISNSQQISGFVWQWGQFVDHDISLNRVSNPAEEFDIPVPKGDPVFDPRGTGKKVLAFQRSAFQIVNGIREQITVNSHWLDASTVYGSSDSLAKELRTFTDGLLKTGTNNLLPFNVDGFPNQPDSSATFFLGGDVRANENVALTSLHTLFLREHNFQAAAVKASHPLLKDEAIYQRARAIVAAEIECITYRDYLPVILGPGVIPPYTGYNSAIDPSVSNEFSTFGFRLHTFLPSVLKRLNAQNRSLGDLPLGAGFFNPRLLPAGGIEPFLRGLANQIPQEVDPYIIDAVRNFLIGGNLRSGFDLAALNIQRGRDHGTAGYNAVRTALGLPAKATFADMTSDTVLQGKLQSAYTSPDDVDAWVGCLVEPHVSGALVGETMWTLIKDQFTRLRDGDRFWYESYLDAATLAQVQAETLATIIRRNTTITTELQDDVFHLP